MGVEAESKKRYGLVLFIMIAMILAGLGFFVQAVKDAMLENTKASLIELAARSSAKVENDFFRRLDTLASLANLEDLENPLISKENKINLIRQEADRGNFLRIGIADTNGDCVTNDGYRFNISERGYFLRALKGEPNVSDRLQDKVGKVQDIIVHAVPVYDKNKTVIGVLFATDRLDHFFSFLQNIYAGSEQKILLANNKGDIIVERNLGDMEKQNFLDMISGSTPKERFVRVEKLIQQPLHGAVQYNIDDISYVAGIHSLKNTAGWNLIVAVPKSSVMLPTNKIMTIAVLLVGILIFLVIISVIYLYILNKKYMEEKAASRLNTERMRIKDAFIANVSHELRTPMNAISGLMYFLKSTKLTDEQKMHLKKIESATQILLGIINDILDISKISSGKMHLVKEPFTLDNAVNSLNDIFADRMQAKGLKWHIERDFLPENWIEGDCQRLLQVLINLVNNAYKFTESGEIHLLVRQLDRSEHQVSYLFSVSDTGIGIEEKDLFRLFTPFEQLESSSTKTYEGTGLGLSISSRLVSEMGGKIEVDSKPGVGSTFYFTLSFKRLNPETAVRRGDFSAALRVRQGARVLLVEDNEVNAEIAGVLLAEMGIVYDWAANGEIAVELCQNQAVDYYQLILMDIQMPVMDGFQAAKKIRQELGVQAPVIALTAGIMEQTFLKDKKYCIDDCILKPFEIEIFKGKVAQFLQ